MLSCMRYVTLNTYIILLVFIVTLLDNIYRSYWKGKYILYHSIFSNIGKNLCIELLLFHGITKKALKRSIPRLNQYCYRYNAFYNVYFIDSNKDITMNEGVD